MGLSEKLRKSAQINIISLKYWSQWKRSAKVNGQTWADGHSSSQFSLLCLTAAENKKIISKTLFAINSYNLKLPYVHDDIKSLPYRETDDTAMSLLLCLAIKSRQIKKYNPRQPNLCNDSDKNWIRYYWSHILNVLLQLAVNHHCNMITSNPFFVRY